MQTLAFAKYQGTGNDFVVVDARARTEEAVDWPQAARFLCDRHYGVGADGVLVLSMDTGAVCRMTVHNADGSTPEMCGNGIRCVAKYLHDRGEVGSGRFAIATGAGVLYPEILPDGQVKVDMGLPGLTRAALPMTGDGGEQAIDVPLAFGDGMVLVTAVSMGNPHAVVFVADVDAVPLAIWGPQLETHPAFPAGTNVEFVQVVGPHHARMRVWERGSGITLACGTGACASLVAGVLTGKLAREAAIQVPGGPLAITWDAQDHVWLTGPAQAIFTGQITLPALRAPAPGGDAHHPDP